MFEYEPYVRRTPIAGRDDSVKDSERQEFLRFAAEFDAPAFIRRAHATTGATDGLFQRCESSRSQLLTLPKTRLAMLAAVIGQNWSALTPGILVVSSATDRKEAGKTVLGTDADGPAADGPTADGIAADGPAADGIEDWDAAYLQALFDGWQPTLRIQVASSDSVRLVAKSVRELAVAFQRFNRKWQQHIDALDLTPVNKVREDYNNYYVVEKACAFGSEKIGQSGFEPLDPITHAEVLQRLPLLRCCPA